MNNIMESRATIIEIAQLAEKKRSGKTDLDQVAFKAGVMLTLNALVDYSLSKETMNFLQHLKSDLESQ